MKKIITIFICNLAFLSMLFGQESQLVLTHKTRGFERVLEEGKKIRVYKSEYLKLKGSLSIIDTASIAIGSDTIPLDSIVKIEAITMDSRPSGVILTTIGALILAGGVVALDEIYSSSDGSSGSSSGDYSFGPSDDAIAGGVGVIMIIGAGITTAGVGKLVTGANYKDKKWAYSIRKVSDIKE